MCCIFLQFVFHDTLTSYNIPFEVMSPNWWRTIYLGPVFPKVACRWMDIWSSKGVRITGPSIKFTGHSHIPQRRCSDSYWSFGPVINNLLLDQNNFTGQCHISDRPWELVKENLLNLSKILLYIHSSSKNYHSITNNWSNVRSNIKLLHPKTTRLVVACTI